MTELFNTEEFSSKNEIVGSTDSAWDDGSAFPSCEVGRTETVTHREMRHGDTTGRSLSPLRAVSSKKNWRVGDRIITPGDQRGLVTSANEKIGITWENGHLGEYTSIEIQTYGYQEYKPEVGAMSTTTPKENAECNSNTPVSLQVSEALNSELKPLEHQTSSKLNFSSKITATLNVSLDTDSQISPFIATSETITPSQENLVYIPQDFLVQGHQSQETVQDSTTQNQNSGLKLCGALPTVAPTSSSLKILQDLSTKDYEQFLGDSEWLAMSGMIRKSYQLRNSDRPSEEKGFSSLPTPTTYAKGSTGCRPAGATRLEQKLRPYIIKGDKLNPAVPGWMMGFPIGWAEWPLMDTGETISVQLPFIPEFATTSTNDAIVTTSTPDQSAPSKPRSQLGESVTLLISSVNRANAQPETYIINQSSYKVGRTETVTHREMRHGDTTGRSLSPLCAESLGIIEDNLGFGFVVNWLSLSEQITYNWERDDQIIAELAIAPQYLIDKFLEEKAGYQVVPENFLEETERALLSTKKPKGRQRKGCLYQPSQY